jgi:S-adenosylmethionine decarboxylase
MKDLAPEIYRQRLVIEGYPNDKVKAKAVKKYLSGLSSALDMRIVKKPVTSRSKMYGEAGWIHWESSGAHFYGWDQPRLFFSVDIYTCKRFKAEDALKYTKDFFKVGHLEYKEF